MKSDPSDGPFASLLSRLVSGQLADGDAARIEHFLRCSKTARDYYRNYLAVHTDLIDHFRENAAAPFPPLALSVRPIKLLALAALLPLALGLGMWWSSVRQPAAGDSGAPQVVLLESESVLAVTGYADNVRWNLPEAPAPGINLSRKSVVLERGLLVLHLIGGQTLTLRGPARFELLNDKEMRFGLGDLSQRVVRNHKTYMIHVPGGVVADLGTEFSVKVAADGTTDVRVFEGKAVASSTDSSNRTRYERILLAGESVRISETLQDSPLAVGEFLRPHPDAVKAPSPAGKSYAELVRNSAPLAWWRFEQEKGNQITAETADVPPLVLSGSPHVLGTPGHRFIYTDTGDFAGFAATETGLAGLDQPQGGISVECLLHPESEQHMTALLLEDLSQPVPPTLDFRPQRIQIERAGRSGEAIGHVHPPYAIRGMARIPSGYASGANTYTADSYLARRWIHVVQTHDGKTLRLYVDGKLVNETPDLQEFQNSLLRPVIAVLRPTQDEFRRQWIGGIDEVALYDRVLTSQEIQTHFQALD